MEVQMTKCIEVCNEYATDENIKPIIAVVAENDEERSLFIERSYVHCPSTASGTRYRRSACIDMNVLRLAAAACFDVCCISAQRGVLRD